MKTSINKNKRLTILTAFLVLLLSSCDEDRLNFLPEDNTVSDLVFTTESTAIGAVIGIYNRAQQDNVLNGTLQFMTEWQADNVAFEGTFPTFRQVRDYTTLANNRSIFAIWDNNYEVIGAANLVIDKVPLINEETFTDAEKNQAVAEARFLRALVYFNISTVFGQPQQVGQGRANLSVPLVISSEEGQKLPRANLGQVYDFVESELLEIIPILATGTRKRANPGAARALLARLYLYQERFAEAATMANTVINNSFYELATDYTFYDNPESTEHIFTLVNNAVDGQTSGQGFSGLSNPPNEGRGDVPFSQNLLDAYRAESGDKRFTTLRQMGRGASGETRTFTNKFPDGTTRADDAPVIRVTEMYLTRAEANLRAGTSTGATPLADINRLRMRAGLSNLTSVDLNAILNERRKELAFEGQRRMDLLRNNMSLRRTGQPQASMSAPGANRTILPIPRQVRDLSPFVVQNTGF